MIAALSHGFTEWFTPSSFHYLISFIESLFAVRFIGWFINSIIHSFPWFTHSFTQPFVHWFLHGIDCIRCHWHLNNHLLIPWCTSQPESLSASASHCIRNFRPSAVGHYWLLIDDHPQLMGSHNPTILNMVHVKEHYNKSVHYTLYIYIHIPYILPHGYQQHIPRVFPSIAQNPHLKSPQSTDHHHCWSSCTPLNPREISTFFTVKSNSHPHFFQLTPIHSHENRHWSKLNPSNVGFIRIKFQ